MTIRSRNKKIKYFLFILGVTTVSFFIFLFYKNQNNTILVNQGNINAIIESISEISPDNKTKNISNKNIKSDIPNVNKIILITIDTLRADHLGYNGYPIDTSPFLDELASKSFNFKNTFSQTTLTVPSNASIFTSLHPLQHKLFQDHMRLDDSFVTMAEFFREKGFKTAAFIGSRHFSKSNIFQGFDKIDMPPKEERFMALMTDTVKRFIRPSNETLDKALSWIKQEEENIFIWIHLFDLHHGFMKQKSENLTLKKFDPYYLKKEYEFLLKEGVIDNNCIFKEGKKIKYNNVEDILETIKNYDNQLKFVDNKIKDFYGDLEKIGFNNNSLWVITSEHGEGLCSHGRKSHFDLYNEIIRTPLIFHFPDDDLSVDIEVIASHVDIFPTMTQLLGVDLSARIPNIQGNSLFDLLDNNYTFSYMHRDSYLNLEGEASLQNKRFKYILNEESEDEFYNLQNDPLEKNNIIKEKPTEAEKFRDEIIEKYNLADETTKIKDIYIDDEETLKQLEWLGYIK
ncbi:sulfatase [Candidatus Falkowbacteria bacterium]|jgi:arylsulfatase A-like enzyme|nr:sulfatase [Candidatus Falkowbacteria bacterium]MBT4433440.1 sulfatase [Candidatus Falkowbacteria bacterium]